MASEVPAYLESFRNFLNVFMISSGLSLLHFMTLFFNRFIQEYVLSDVLSFSHLFIFR